MSRERRFRVEGAAVIVTGGASGIGRAVSLLLARRGAHVVVADLHDRPPTGERPVVEAIGTAGGPRALFRRTDVADPEAAGPLVEEAVRAFGRLDAVVHCAGIGQRSRLADTPAELVRRIPAVDLLGPIWIDRAAIPRLRRPGRIVHVASAQAVVGMPANALYSAAKAGLLRLSESLDRELAASGIRVSAVLPDATRTPFTVYRALDRERPPSATRTFLPREDEPRLRVGRLDPPERVARAIARCLVRPRRVVYLGRRLRLAALLQQIAPSLVDRMVAGIVREIARDLERDRPT